MIYSKAQITITAILFTIFQYKLVNTITVKELFTPIDTLELEYLENSEDELLTIVRVPREVSGSAKISSNPTNINAKNDGSVSRVARDSGRYHTDKFATKRFKDGEREDRSLKPEDHADDERSTKSSTTGKRCTTCDSGYLGSSSYYNRGRDRDRYDRYDRDPYQYSSRSRYDPYDRYSDRDNKNSGYDRYDDYDRDYRDYRGRNRYSTGSYDRYEPRDRYYDRGVGYDSRGYDFRSRDIYSPYSRDSRYDPYSQYDDYYSRGSDSYMSKGYGGRPEYSGGGGYYGGAGSGGIGSSGYYGGAGGIGATGYYGGGASGGGIGSTGYARGYSYGDRDRYGGSGNGYGNAYGSGYGSSGYGSGSTYGSRSRYPATYDYEPAYRPTSYLYGRPSTTTDNPKGSEGDSSSNTMSPSQGASGGGGGK